MCGSIRNMTMEYGTITGRLVAAVADTTDDPDVNPDIVPISGTVTFTPSVKAILVVSEDITVVPAPIVAALDANGYVSLNGVQGVTVLATNSTYYNPTGWTYRVSFDNLSANGRRVTFDPYNIEVPVGANVDLSFVTPVQSSTGQAIVQGPKGDKGDPGASTNFVASTGQDPAASDLAGGLVGDNGRATDLVVGSDGSTPDSVLRRWAPRLGGLGLTQMTTGYSGTAEGGLVGENGRQTDFVFDASGKALLPTILEWVQRAAPYLNSVLPSLPLSQSSYDAVVENSRGILVSSPDGTQAFVSDATRLAAWGDSLTQGWPIPPFASDGSNSWPGVFGSGWAGAVTNNGIQGQSADEIALRQGGYLLALTVNGGQIPASGSVAVTTAQLYGFRTDRSWSCAGYLIGDDGTKIYGTLTRTGTSSSGAYDAANTKTFTFARATAGNAVAVAALTTFRSTQGEAAKDAVQVVFAGRNDIGYTIPGADIVKRVVAATIAMKERPGARHARRLVVGTTTNTNEKAGSAGYVSVTSINAQLAALYPDSWFDLRAYLVKQVIYDLGITPTATDLDRMSGDTLPPSIMANYTTDGNGNPSSWDAVHYSPATAAKVASKLQAVLTAKGWII